MTNVVAGLEHMFFLARHSHGCGVQSVIVMMLLELGFPTNHLGYKYLKAAILMRYRNPEAGYFKEIYPSVAKMYNTLWERVEKDIRYTIGDAWKNRDEAVWCYYFPASRGGHIPSRTSSEFISQIVCYLELWEACREEVADNGQYQECVGDEIHSGTGRMSPGRAAEGVS